MDEEDGRRPGGVFKGPVGRTKVVVAKKYWGRYPDILGARLSWGC